MINAISTILCDSGKNITPSIINNHEHIGSFLGITRITYIAGTEMFGKATSKVDYDRKMDLGTKLYWTDS